MYTTNNWSGKLLWKKVNMLNRFKLLKLMFLLTVLLLCDVNKPVARMLVSVILCEYAHFTICDWYESTKTNPVMLRWLLLKTDERSAAIFVGPPSVATLSYALTIEHRESRILNCIYLCCSTSCSSGNSNNNNNNNVFITEWRAGSCLTESSRLVTSKSRRLNCFSIKWLPVSRCVASSDSSSDGLVTI